MAFRSQLKIRFGDIDHAVGCRSQCGGMPGYE